ncbi:MAG: hypothetical protein JW833_05970 [Prolixibacteraceae bacterium]|nr:hypothetical protein [Prolixibacteraceae bacterium]
MKIRSLFFNLAQAERITADELEDYNRAAAEAFEALDDFKFIIDKLKDEKKVAIDSREKLIEVKNKLLIITEMLGISDNGKNKLLSFPCRFLENINRALQRHGTPLQGENYFRLIEQKFRWFERMIERDKGNIESIKIQLNLFQNKNPEVKKMAKTIMQQIASESQHIIDGLRDGKSFEELKEQIEEYWYDQLSTHSIIER